MRYSYATQNEVPDVLRAEYEERDGAFVLKIEELPEGVSIENVSGLKNALKAERANNKTLGTRLAELEGGNATEHQKLAGKVDQLSTQNQKLLSELNAQRLTNLTTEAITEARGNPSLLRPVLEKRIRLDDAGKPQVIDDAGQPLLDMDGTPVSIRSFLLALREMPAYMGAFAGTGNSGSGTPPSGGNGGGTVTIAKRRSEMTIAEKAAFIKANGVEKLLDLPV